MKARALFVALGSAALLSFTPVVSAQQSGVVNVELRNVANNIAKNINVDVSQIPVTVQAPVSVAATVCGIEAAVLTQQAAGGNATCTAKSTSSALDQIVQTQLKGTTQQ